MKRRTFLAAGSLAIAPLTGCIGSTMPGDAVVNTVEESTTGGVDVVSYTDLPQAEKRIARTAVEENFYHACPELPDALRSFADRFQTLDDSYLGYQDTAYGVWIRIEDTIRVDTASPPDADPSCGFL